MRPINRLLTALALAALAATPPLVYGQAMSADEAFADGNRLFRDGLYWAALLRYEQAAEAGMNSPLLNYNAGVSHYRARQYERAADAFHASAEAPQLEVLSHYNLGLSAYAAGDHATALRWLRRARDQERSRKISRLAEKTIDLIRRDVLFSEESGDQGQEPAILDEEEPARELGRDPRPFAEYDVFARVGFGSDDNVYRTPSDSYLDLSDKNLPVTADPVVQSGSYVPVLLSASYQVNSFEHESFFARYRGWGHFYSGEELRNADEFSNELALGTEYRKERENRQNRLFTAFTIARHQETFFDPDSGGVRISDTVDIGDRYSYLRYGPELWTRQSWDRFAFRFWAKAQLWNYENTEAVPEYDHKFFQVGTHLQYRFTKTSLLRLFAQGYMRDFSDRPSFDLNGDQPVTNPSVEYTYIDYGVTARQRLTGSLWFGVKYVFTERIDQYVGYNDYTRDGFGAELHLGIGNNFSLDADAMYRIYNYTNAYAFNNPAAGRKTLETASGRISASYTMPWNLRLIGDFAYEDVASNDARIAYERNRFMLSLEWTYE